MALSTGILIPVTWSDAIATRRNLIWIELARYQYNLIIMGTTDGQLLACRQSGIASSQMSEWLQDVNCDYA